MHFIYELKMMIFFSLLKWVLNKVMCIFLISVFENPITPGVTGQIR